MAIAMAKRKPKKFKDASSVVGAKARQNGMTQPGKYDMFAIAAVALVVAVCVVPLTAEISTCKYPGLLTNGK